ncbi:ATP-dependent helicase HrpB [Pseudomaricurvus sp. HS19]|uniref:ATP-dependent helicase HrpB n=1 Tax=Pseudomaricurvus sp. HS19 TaxID=2692626 RepID=UPI0013713943|nr:ATP-dependent helicase HrpB [Pseudomaricurvus sp. HS19]MYM61869.1 ATP-dependent helicase HrpB [Pseudomaricurvus sp. HS19]
MSELPIQEVIPAIREALNAGDELVLEAPPGAGKTTLVPLALLQESWLQGQKIIMLEPRRLAARGAAERLAANLGEPVGATVGYRVRLDSKVGPDTRIEVVTEGILGRWLQDDPSLDGVGLLIFDEFHERSLDADTGLALTLQGRDLFADLREQPLKLLVMSATLEGDRVSTLLGGAPVVRSEGRAYPVDIRYGDPYRFDQRTDARVVATVLQALQEEEGSLLVFLPGVGEIRRVEEQLRERLTDSSVLLAPLYGDLSLDQQRLAIAPSPQGQRKVVLATSIAESSLTIDGVRVVVDAGLSRGPAFDPVSGLTRLNTRRVSRASSEQRAGRAGRTAPGACYRLWSRQQQDELAAYPDPEITNADLAPLALQLLAWGCNDPTDLLWLDPPAVGPFRQALEMLHQLGAVSADLCQLTELGQQLPALPAHPRLAAMMLEGQQLGHAQLACQLAALLSERDPINSGSADIGLRLELLNGERKIDGRQRSAVERLRQQVRQYLRILPDLDHGRTVNACTADQAVGLLLACAYPDRVALRRSEQGRNYQMANGRSVELAEGDPLAREPALVIAAAGGQQGRSQDRVFLAAALDMALFQSLCPERLQSQVVVEWDERAGKLVAEEQLKLGRLVLQRQRLTDVQPEIRQQALVELVAKRGLSLFDWSEEVQQWRGRVMLMRSLQDGENSPWPDVSDTGLLATLHEWLAPYINDVSKLEDFRRLNLLSMLQSLLPWPLPAQLDEQVPTHVVVPSGSRIAIDYTQTPPVLAVKLQEMFGCVDTPTVAGGRVRLLCHLLSPARRPLQVTQDLRGFWSGSYEHVKKEMKGRYPKHPWPDDPLQALPTAKTKRHL